MQDHAKRLADWYRNLARPFLERNAPERLSNFDRDCDRLTQSAATLGQELPVCFLGNSGVGKSTLINALLPGANIKTNVVSGWSGKGQHTTTFAEMFDLPDGGEIIDTPGVKEFGLIDFEREELAQKLRLAIEG